MSEKVNPEVKKKIDNIFDDDTDNQEVSTREEAISSVTPADTKSKAAKFLDDVEEEEPKKAEKKIDATPIKQRITELYAQCLESAKLKDKENILSTYVEDLYNPKTTKLDDGNLLLNLLVLSRLQELDIIDFYFDENMKNITSSDYQLDLKWYEKILEQPVEEQAKYVHILESNFKLKFYKNMFESIVKSADKMAYNQNRVKMKNVWKFIDDETSTDFDIEEYLIQFIEEKTSEGSVIMVTPDLTPYFKFESKNEEEYAEKPYIKLVGKWKNRFVYEIDTNQVAYLKGFKRGAFFIKEGNRYVVNPTKPLAYFNTIENPFINNPILMMFSSLDFNFYTSATTFLRVEDM